MDDATSQMLTTIEAHFRATADRTGLDGLSPRVRQALVDVPRSAFVPPAQASGAHADRALPIGEGQTISQPFIVALMTELLGIRAGQRVLEVGTGSGYQAAVLAALGAEVVTIERVPALAASAAARLARHAPEAVQVHCADGTRGWPEAAPFERIVITAAGPAVPPTVLAHLAAGGRLVAPVGPPGQQVLLVVQRDGAGHDTIRRILDVAFVPLIAGA